MTAVASVVAGVSMLSLLTRGRGTSSVVVDHLTSVMSTVVAGALGSAFVTRSTSVVLAMMANVAPVAAHRSVAIASLHCLLLELQSVGAGRERLSWMHSRNEEVFPCGARVDIDVSFEITIRGK